MSPQPPVSAARSHADNLHGGDNDEVGSQAPSPPTAPGNEDTAHAKIDKLPLVAAMTKGKMGVQLHHDRVTEQRWMAQDEAKQEEAKRLRRHLKLFATAGSLRPSKILCLSEGEMVAALSAVSAAVPIPSAVLLCVFRRRIGALLNEQTREASATAALKMAWPWVVAGLPDLDVLQPALGRLSLDFEVKVPEFQKFIAGRHLGRALGEGMRAADISMCIIDCLSQMMATVAASTTDLPETEGNVV